MTASTDPPEKAEIDVLDQLTDRQQARVHAVLEAATEADDVAPVSEHVVLKLRAGREGGGRHLLLGSVDGLEDRPLLGYGYLEDAEPGFRDVEFVVHPRFRRAG